MAWQGLAAEFLQVPAVTRAYTAACVLTTAAVQLELLSPFQLYFNPHLVFRKFQVWRLVTNFLFFGPLGFSFFFNILFVYPAPCGHRLGGGQARRAGRAPDGETEAPPGGTSYTDAIGSAIAACWKRAPSAAARPTSSSCFSSGASL